MKKFLIGIIFFNSFYSVSQSIELNASQKSQIRNNIIFYHLRNADIFNEDNCNININKKISGLLPNNNEILIIEISRSNLKFPNNTIKLFEVVNPYFSYRNTEKKTVTTREFMDGIPLNFRLARKYLIGLNTESQTLLYVSGKFYKSCISEYFTLKKTEPQTFTDFLKIKLFNYNIRDIHYIKNRKNYLIFNAYSEIYRTRITIKVNEKDFDDVSVTLD